MLVATIGWKTGIEAADTMVIDPAPFTELLGQGKADIQPMTVIVREVFLKRFNPVDKGLNVVVETWKANRINVP